MTAAEIERAVEAAGLKPLKPGAADLFVQYVELLLRWNARLNLTAIREPSMIVQRHLVECIQCAQALPAAESLLDFGSGAGLPGIPIAIVRPEIAVTLGESQGRKAGFLREVVRVLGLNAQVFTGRIEKMAAGQTFDVLTLRAVDRMHEAVQMATARIRAGGLLVLFATVATENGLKDTVPSLTWEAPIPLFGMETGVLLFGRKECFT
ncbi:MAG: 16S rRNA (guanine(527)-N(7))-methyltransferase RsmG [Silvibacterium sp.]|nr:16S rRNA (guanine(527)-N(7))-methyltransferase RsmG [Silvibacterium sp.]